MLETIYHLKTNLTNCLEIEGTRNVAPLNKESEILSRNIQEARNIASLHKEVDKLAEMIKEAGKIVSLNT